VADSLRAPRVPREAAPPNKTLGSAALSDARTAAVEQAQDPSRNPGPVRKATLLQGSLNTALDGQAPGPTPTPSPYVVPLPTPPPAPSVPVASTLSSAIGAAAAAKANSTPAQPVRGTAFGATVAAPLVTPPPAPTPAPIVTPPPAPATAHVSSPNLGDTAQSPSPMRTPPPAPAPVWQPIALPEVTHPPAWQKTQRAAQPAKDQKKSNVPLLVAIALALTVMLVVVAIVANQLAH
jgi:hypothetical protein